MSNTIEKLKKELAEKTLTAITTDNVCSEESRKMQEDIKTIRLTLDTLDNKDYLKEVKYLVIELIKQIKKANTTWGSINKELMYISSLSKVDLKT